MSVWDRAAASAAAPAAAAAELLTAVASLFFSFSLGEWGPVLMGTGSRNFIGSADFPSERSGTHLKKNSYMFFWRLAPLTVVNRGHVSFLESRDVTWYNLNLMVLVSFHS